MAKVEELLNLSAPLAWRLAPQSCRRDPVTGEDCSYSHSVWQYLTLMGLIGTVDSRRDFYLNALQAITAGKGRPRVLISGAADYIMLDLLLVGFRERGIEPDITVTDLCETPLALNRWYAERVSCDIETVRCDIFELRAAVPFDAVCTDYFLTKFPAARRSALLAKWRGLLRPDGVVITATRLRPASEGERAGFSPEQVAQLRVTVSRLAREMQNSLRVDPDQLAERAAVFATRYVTHAVHTPEEVRALFEGCGFDVSHLSVGKPFAGTIHDVSGPTVRGDAKRFVTVIARHV